MKVLKKCYKYIIAIIILVVISVLILFIYNNMFKENISNRLEGIENYNITKTEKNDIKAKFKELEQVESIKISVNSKIIKIFLTLKEEVSFDIIKDYSNQAVQKISEKNLSFYDVEIFIECENEESEVYPKIGYKHKTKLEFTWNR